MSLPSDLRLRDAALDDLPAIGALRESVGWSVNEWALRAVIGQSHARCLVATTHDGTLAGVGSGIVYGPLGFIGNMIVTDAHRRRGLGSAILASITAFLESAGCPRLELNATSEGRSLYERHGFASIGRSTTAKIPRSVGLHAEPALRLRRAGADETDTIATIAAYDLPRFGGDRRALLAIILADPASIGLVAERDGRMVGYACVRTDAPRIGPMVADEPAVAEALLLEAFGLLPGVDGLRLNLPPGNEPGAGWLRGLEVPIEPWDGRMARGPQIPRRDDAIYGMAVGALG